MSECPENKLIRQREGTTQQKRYNTILNPDNVKLMGFDVGDWMNFAQKFAKNINFFDNEDYENPQGNWEPFHNATTELKKIANTYNEGKINPQLALFISFLKLLNLSKERFNNITKRHLDFYYKQVLQLEKKEAQEDSVYLIFELAKNATEQLLEKNILLNAGKDAEGKKLNYGLKEEIVINKATISAIKNTYIDADAWYASNIANSGDGEGGEIENDKKSWFPFGDKTRTLAKKGFSIAAPSLKLTEGPRNLDLKITLDELSSRFKNRKYYDILRVEHTGEKKWIDITEKITEIKTEDKSLTISISLDESEKTIESYDKEIHKGNYNTTHPLLRIIFDAKEDQKATSYKLYKELSIKELVEVNLTTEAIYTTNLEVKNDLGKINLENPFYPFGPQAKKNAKLKIGAKEWIGKQISDVTLSLKWKDLPENLETYYEHYKSELVNFNTNTNTELKKDSLSKFTSLVTGVYGENRFNVDLSYINDHRTIIPQQQTTPEESAQQSELQQAIDKDPFSFNDVTYFLKKDALEADIFDVEKSKLSLIDKKADATRLDKLLLSANKKADITKTKKTLSPIDLEKIRKQFDELKNRQLFAETEYKKFKQFLPKGSTYILKPTDDYLIQLSLKNNFLHTAYAKIYTYLALNKLSLPNEPYTPFVEKLKVTITTNESLSENQKIVSLFHEHPFGTSKVDGAGFEIVPKLETGGHLFIGFDKTEEKQNIQVLFQVEEGSENPKPTETNKNSREKKSEKIEWLYLKNNEWLDLETNYLLKDETDNLLKTGLVKFTVPKDCKNNSFFDEDYFWVQIKKANIFDSVSNIVNIHAQAIDAKFINNNNTLEHIDKGLEPNTISKLETRLATIKKMEQPYTSFDGIPKESDLNYYRRISERLRHKNRAITVWDYEHLILQEFTYLHKIKCLNHSTKESFIAPGDVLLVAVPNIINQNVYNIYQPKLSKAKLNKIQDYINKLNTLHVDAKVISPEYEPVTIDLKAILKENYDPNFYEKQLQFDIAAYLSPWAFDNKQSISFGNALYHSEVIYFIENLEYVDYIKDFKMLHNNEVKKEIIPTDQKSILTTIEPILHKVKVEIKSLCQQ